MPTYRPRQQETYQGTGNRPQMTSTPQASPWGLQTNPLAQMNMMTGLGNIWGMQQPGMGGGGGVNPLLGQMNPMAALLGLGPQVGQMKPPEPPGAASDIEQRIKVNAVPGSPADIRKPGATAKPKIENPLAGLGMAQLLAY